MPTDCRVVLQLQAECFRTQGDATLKVAPSTLQPTDPLRDCRPEELPHETLGLVSAYLQGDLEEGETVYCSAPPGPYSQQGEDGHLKAWRVDRPIYGLAQAGRRWQRSLFEWLKSWGLRQQLGRQRIPVHPIHTSAPRALVGRR